MLKSAVRFALHQGGGLGLVRASNRKALRILMHHRFPAGQETALEMQCAHIRKHYHPISMTEVGRRLRAGDPLPENAVAITVDDGYRDFLERGSPILVRYGIPATLYLVTDFVDGKDWLWMDRIKYAIANTREKVLEVALGGETLRFGLETEAARAMASQALREKTKRAGNADRLRLIAELPMAAKVTFPVAPPAEMAPLSWSEVRSLRGNGLEFGPHTMSHPILSSLRGANELRREIGGSKARVEEELGVLAEHFCYPSGQPVDVSMGALEAVKEAGFATAVMSEIGLALRGDDPLTLRRIGVDPGLPEYYFQELLAGFRPTLRPVPRSLRSRLGATLHSEPRP